MNDLLEAADTLAKAVRAGTDTTAALNAAETAIRTERAREELAQLEAEQARLNDKLAAAAARAAELETITGKRRSRRGRNH